MTYTRFASFNVIGGIAWVSSFLFLGYFFGGLPVIKNNFTYVIFGIIFLSILPPIIEVIRERMKSESQKDGK
jgi:membrane-associated protein